MVIGKNGVRLSSVELSRSAAALNKEAIGMFNKAHCLLCQLHMRRFIGFVLPSNKHISCTLNKTHSLLDRVHILCEKIENPLLYYGDRKDADFLPAPAQFN